MSRILHLSDLHLAETTGGEAALARFQSVLAAIQQFGPYDAVVLTGDICDDGSLEATKTAYTRLTPLAPVVLAVPGNHDVASVVYTVFGSATAQLDEWLIVGVATNVTGQVHGDGRPLASTLRDLEASAAGHPAVILYHHPVHTRSTHEWFTLAHRDEALEALSAHTGPLLLLSGHTHEAFDSRHGQVHFIGAPSTYYGLEHEADQFRKVSGTTGAAIIDLSEAGESRSFVVHA